MQEGILSTVSESSKTSNETLFELKKSGVASTCVSVTVDFSPFQPQNVQYPSGQPFLPTVRSIPIYNTDNNYFTPSFVLESDKEKYHQNKMIYQQLFEQKIQQVDQESNEMVQYLPRPSKTNSFCCVCKMIFDDYLTHVNLPIHKAFMEKSQFHAEIKTLCGKFTSSGTKQTRKKTIKKEPKTKAVRKQRKAAPREKRQKRVQIESVSTSRGHSSNEGILVDGNC